MQDKTSIIKSMFVDLETELDETNVVRDELVCALKKGFDEFLDTANGGKRIIDMGAAERESFMSVVRETRSLLDAKDNAHLKKIGLMLKQFQHEDDSDNYREAVEVMRAFNANSISFVPHGGSIEDAAKAAKARFLNEGMAISEGELIRESKLESLVDENQEGETEVND